MAANKKSFVLYTEWQKLFDTLDVPAAGELIKAIFAYQAGKKVELNPVLSLVFINIKQTLDRDRSNWLKTREKRKIAGSLGGRKRVENERLSSKSYAQTPSKSKQIQANQAVNVNVNEEAAATEMPSEIKLLADILKDKFRYEGGKAYRQTKSGWSQINNPLSYLKKLQEQPPDITPTVITPVEDMTDDQLKQALKGKRPGIDDISESIFYEADKRGLI